MTSFISEKDDVYDSIVISGGSTSGLTMLGKLYHLSCNGNLVFSNIKTFSGTSVGSIISLLLSIGFSPGEIAYHIYNCDIWDKMIRFDPRRIIQGLGCFSTELMRKELETMITQKIGFVPKLGELEKNFLCATFNLDTCELEYLSSKCNKELCCVQAVLMSCAIPMIFEPCIFNKTRYIDGGILDNCPILSTINIFDAKNLVAIRCIKNNVDNVNKYTWSWKDMLTIIFASSNYHMKSQIKKAKEISNLKIINVNSSIPFYDLRLSKKKIAEMFLSGFLN